MIEKASEFLTSRQLENGQFVELGRVIHRDMQGGVESKQTITAYVTIALIESGLSQTNRQVDAAIKLALAFLEKEASNVVDTYSQGLIAYALNLGKSEQADKFFGVFQAKSMKKPDGGMYWPSKSSNDSDSSSTIELSSYGLLLNLKHNDFSSALSIVRYLVGQSNSLGGYSNTQDTVLALEALSAFAIATYSSTSNSSSRVELTTTTSLIDENDSSVSEKSFKTNDDNSMVLQTWNMPKCEKKVRVNANGIGKSMFQLVVTYNTPKAAVDTPTFSLAQKVSRSNNGAGILNVKTCVTYSKGSQQQQQEHDSTGMTVLEATLLSGYEADKQDLIGLVESKQVGYLKLTEIKEQNVVFYFDQLDNGKELCVDWKMIKQAEVDNLQGVPLKVYDYYQSSFKFETIYMPNF